MKKLIVRMIGNPSVKNDKKEKVFGLTYPPHAEATSSIAMSTVKQRSITFIVTLLILRLLLPMSLLPFLTVTKLLSLARGIKQKFPLFVGQGSIPRLFQLAKYLIESLFVNTIDFTSTSTVLFG